VERVGVDCRFGLGEKFDVGFPEDRAVRGDGFEPLPVEMVCEFACERVEPVEVTVELVVAIVRADEASVALEEARPRTRVGVDRKRADRDSNL
jgi:hypothetical protein